MAQYLKKKLAEDFEKFRRKFSKNLDENWDKI